MADRFTAAPFPYRPDPQPMASSLNEPFQGSTGQAEYAGMEGGDDSNSLAERLATRTSPPPAAPAAPVAESNADPEYNSFARFGVRTPSQSSTMGDIGRGLVGGALGTVGSMAAAGEWAFGSGGNFSAARETLEGASNRVIGGASEGFQTALRREFLPGGEGPSAYDSPGAFFGALGAQAVASLPSTLISLVPAGIAGRAATAAATRMAGGLTATGSIPGMAMAAGTATAGLVTGLITGSQVGGATWQGISEAWRTAPAEEVQQSPLYRQFYEAAQGTPEERDRLARELAARESRPYAPLIAGAIGAAAGALLEAPLAMSLARREIGVLQGIRSGMAREAGEEGIQGVSQEGMQQNALADPQGLNRPYDPMEIARQGVQGAVVGGAVGGVVGGLGGLAGRPPAAAQPPQPPEQPQGSTGDPALDAAARAPAPPPGDTAAPPPSASESAATATANGVDPAIAAASAASAPPTTPSTTTPAERRDEVFMPGIGPMTVVRPPEEPLVTPPPIPPTMPNTAPPPMAPPANDAALTPGTAPGLVSGLVSNTTQTNPVPSTAEPTPAAPPVAAAPTAGSMEAAQPDVLPGATPTTAAAPPAPTAPVAKKSRSEAASAARVGKRDIEKILQSETTPTPENLDARQKAVQSLMARAQDKRRSVLTKIAEAAQKANVPVPAWVQEGLEIAGRGKAAEGNTERWAAWAEKHGKAEEAKVEEQRRELPKIVGDRRMKVLDVFAQHPPSEVELQAMRSPDGEQMKGIVEARRKRLSNIVKGLKDVFGTTKLNEMRALMEDPDSVTGMSALLRWLDVAQKNLQYAHGAGRDVFNSLTSWDYALRDPDTGKITEERALDLAREMRAEQEMKSGGTVSLTKTNDSESQTDIASAISDDSINIAEGLDPENEGVIQDEAQQDAVIDDTVAESTDSNEEDANFDLTEADAEALGAEGVRKVMERRQAWEESQKGRERKVELKGDEINAVTAEDSEARMKKVRVTSKGAVNEELRAKLREQMKAMAKNGGLLKRIGTLFGMNRVSAERVQARLAESIDNAVHIGLATDKATKEMFFTPRKGLRGVLDRTIMRTLDRSVGKNTLVVVVPDQDWNRAWGRNVGEETSGVFLSLPLEDVAADGVAGTVYIPERILSEPAGFRREVYMHELTHAATEYSISRNRENRSRVQRLMGEVQAWVDENDVLGITQQQEPYQYAMSDVDEFVAMAFSNQGIQNLLKRVTLDAQQRERLGLTGRIATAWDAFVQAVRKMLGLPANTTTALEGIIEIVGDNMAGPEFNIEAARRLIKQGEADEAFLRPLMNSAQGLQNARRAIADSSMNLGDSLKKAGPVMATMRQLELATKNWWKRTARMNAFDSGRLNPIEMLSRAVLSQSQRAENILADEFNTVLSRYADVPKARRDAIAALLVDSTMANVHPDVPITDAKNKHITKSTSPEAKQARARHPDLEKRFNALADPADRKLFLDIVDMTRQGHERLIKSVISMLLDRWWDMRAAQSVSQKKPLPLPMSRADFDAMKQRFLDAKESNADQRVVDEAVFKLIATARERAKIEGVYVPLQRIGDFVVRWQTRDNPVLEYATEAELDREIGAARENVVAGSRQRVVYDSQNNELSDEYLEKSPAYKLLERGLITVAEGRLPATATQEDKDKARKSAIKDARKTFRDTAVSRGGREAWRAKLVTQGVAFYDTKAEAVRKVEELKAQGHTGVKPVDLRANPRDVVGVLDGELQRLIAAVEKDDQLSSDERDALAGALGRALTILTPSKSLEAAQIHRKGVQGASQELERVLANYATANANYVAANEHQLDIQRGLQAMQENIAEASDPNATTPENRVIAMRRVLQELQTRTTRDALDPMAVSDNTLESVIRKTQSVAFLYYLVSPAYAMIQLLQPYMLSAPVLAGRFGAGGVRALGKAMSDLGMGSLLAGGAKEAARALKTFASQKGVGQSADLFSIARTNIAKTTDGAALVRMLDELQREGLVGNSSGLEVIRTLKARDGVLGTNLAKAEAFGRAIPGAIEVVNRVGTAVAAYRLAIKRGDTHEQATDYARQVVDQTQADYSAANTSRFMRPSNLTLRALTSPMMTFRKYAQAMYALLGTQTYIAFKGASPQERKEARRVLLGIMATHMAMAGALGLPTEGIFLALGAVALALGEDEPWDIEKELRNVAADALGAGPAEMLMRGLPRGLGMDLSNRVGLDSLLFMKDMQDYKPATITGYMGDLVLGAPGGIATRWLSVPGLLNDGEYGKAMEALLPKGVSDVFKANRIAEQGITTRRGERIDGNREAPVSETIMQALGIAPAATAEIYERRNAVQGENRRISQERNDLMRRWRQAPPGERSRIFAEQIRPWNQNLPPGLRETRISYENLTASLREQTRRARESQGQDYLPRNRRVLREEGRFANVPE